MGTGRAEVGTTVFVTLVALSLVGCPHLLFAPSVLGPAPSFPGPEPGASDSELVPVTLDLDTEGHFLLFRLRVDGRNLEPTAGRCRRWLLVRVAREAEAAPRAFCGDDDAWFYLAAGVWHTLELDVESEHTVVKRVVLRPGQNVRWRMPITTGPVQLSIQLEPGHSYTVVGNDEALDLRRALAADAPSGTSWGLDAHERVYRPGVEVGSMRFRILRDGRELVREVSVPLYSGRMHCAAPFCPEG